MEDGAEEVENQRNGEQEGQHITHGLTDLHTEEAQQAGQYQNQGNKEDAVAGGVKAVAPTGLISLADLIAGVARTKFAPPPAYNLVSPDGLQTCPLRFHFH